MGIVAEQLDCLREPTAVLVLRHVTQDRQLCDGFCLPADIINLASSLHATCVELTNIRTYKMHELSNVEVIEHLHKLSGFSRGIENDS